MPLLNQRFNLTYHEAVLDAFLIHTVAEVQAITEDWLEQYNAIRPHEARHMYLNAKMSIHMAGHMTAISHAKCAMEMVIGLNGLVCKN